jgi:hypothetical protein
VKSEELTISLFILHSAFCLQYALFIVELLDSRVDLPAGAIEGTVSPAAARVCGGGADFAVTDVVQRNSRADVRRRCARVDVRGNESRLHIFGAATRRGVWIMNKLF